MNRKYLLVELRHTGRQDQSLDHESVGPASSSVAVGQTNESGDDSKTEYQNHFLSVPDDVQWRDRFWVLGEQPLKPRVDGPQMATVVGPAGEEIYCDEYGRVKVQFPWDRYGKSDENSSCWVRVSQLWAGAKYGGMAIPRIGHEVIVEHLDGDIDQPIITGRTYHETQKVPYDLPANKTRTVWKSDTHKGDGYNELRFEDEAGKEEIWIHGQKDRNEVINNDRNKSVGNNQTESVGVDKSIAVGNTHTEQIGSDKTMSVGGNHTETIQKNAVITTALNRALTVGIAHAEQVGAAKNVVVGASYTTQVGINKSTAVGANYDVVVGEQFSITCGASKFIMSKSGKVEIYGTEFLFAASGPVKVKGKVIDLN